MSKIRPSILFLLILQAKGEAFPLFILAQFFRLVNARHIQILYFIAGKFTIFLARARKSDKN